MNSTIIRKPSKPPAVQPRRKSYIELKEQYIERETHWNDPEFPANDSSIFERVHGTSNIVWKRPHEICNNPQMTVAGTSYQDVVQGELGNCWLVSAIASLATNQRLLDRVFPPNQSFDAAGIIRFHFWQCGEWVEVLVDDRLPTRHNKLIYIHSTDENEFWIAFLEKAYAKMYGSYGALVSGRIGEALTNFTGGVSETYPLKGKADPDLFKIMFKANKNGSLLGCGIDALDTDEKIAKMLDEEFKSKCGLASRHSYTIMDVRMMKLKHTNNPIALVKIRNPWGDDVEWKGAWRDGSNEWLQLVSEEEKDMGFKGNPKDGEFWMSYEDFHDNFDSMEICHLNPDDIFTIEENEKNIYRGKWQRRFNAGGKMANGSNKITVDTFFTNPQYRVSVLEHDEGETTGTLIIGLMQKGETRKKKKLPTELLNMGYAVIEAPPNCIEPLDRFYFSSHKPVACIGDRNNNQELTGLHKLKLGNYIVVPFTIEAGKEGEYVLRIFCDKAKNKVKLLDHQISNTGIRKAEIGIIKTPKEKKTMQVLMQDFIDMAGEDGEIDAFELLDILNKRKLSKENFTIDLTRSMVAMKDTDFNSKLNFTEYRSLHHDLRWCERTFELNDPDKKGYFDTSQFKTVLNLLGMSINNDALRAIIMRYSDKAGHVRFCDFLACYIKLKTMFASFSTKKEPKKNEAKFAFEEFLVLTMYS